MRVRGAEEHVLGRDPGARRDPLLGGPPEPLLDADEVARDKGHRRVALAEHQRAREKVIAHALGDALVEIAGQLRAYRRGDADLCGPCLQGRSIVDFSSHSLLHPTPALAGGDSLLRRAGAYRFAAARSIRRAMRSRSARTTSGSRVN